MFENGKWRSFLPSSLPTAFRRVDPSVSPCRRALQSPVELGRINVVTSLLRREKDRERERERERESTKTMFENISTSHLDCFGLWHSKSGCQKIFSGFLSQKERKKDREEGPG